jgi:hypothetical protein
MADKIVRFKMRVVDNDRDEATLARVVMNSVTDTTTPKDTSGVYVAGEPQNALRFKIKNPEVADLFHVGQDYYVDFTETKQEEGSNDDPDSNVEGTTNY